MIIFNWKYLIFTKIQYANIMQELCNRISTSYDSTKNTKPKHSYYIWRLNWHLQTILRHDSRYTYLFCEKQFVIIIRLKIYLCAYWQRTLRSAHLDNAHQCYFCPLCIRDALNLLIFLVPMSDSILLDAVSLAWLLTWSPSSAATTLSRTTCAKGWLKGCDGTKTGGDCRRDLQLASNPNRSFKTYSWVCTWKLKEKIFIQYHGSLLCHINSALLLCC